MRNLLIVLTLLAVPMVAAAGDACQVKSPTRLECHVEYYAPAGESDTVRFILDGLQTLKAPCTAGMTQAAWVRPGVIVQENATSCLPWIGVATFTNTTTQDKYGTARLIYETR